MNDYEFTEAKNCRTNGVLYPYHNKQPTSRAEVTALAILYDLEDRKGIKQELQAVDAEIRIEIVKALTNIIEMGDGYAKH